MRNVLIILLVLLIALAGGILWSQRAEAPTDEPRENGRVMDIQTYVRQNITDLSPEPAVLGGTFYVTEINTDDDSGTVSYEDGHIAFTADFEYVIDEYGITISSFEVRE
jgi:hypothetical protein